MTKKLTQDLINTIEELGEEIKNHWIEDTISTVEQLESPIEQYFWAHWLAKISIEGECGIDLRPQHPIYDEKDKRKPIKKQKVIYLIDFALFDEDIDFLYFLHINGIEAPGVGVEIHSHDWHEKTKKQAEYDKRRDRYLTQHGWTILYFTASEVYKDPWRCIEEVIDFYHKTMRQYKEMYMKHQAEIQEEPMRKHKT